MNKLSISFYDYRQKFFLGDKVCKKSGSQWRGTIVGAYQTDLTQEGYAIESDTEKGSVQIYPASAIVHDVDYLFDKESASKVG